MDMDNRKNSLTDVFDRNTVQIYKVTEKME